MKADHRLPLTEDLIDIIAMLEMVAVPFRVIRTRSYIYIDTDLWRFQFTPGGKLRGKKGIDGCVPRPGVHRKKEVGDATTTESTS